MNPNALGKDSAAGHRRVKQITTSFVLSLVNRFVSILTNWLSTPFLILTLGKEQFGVWAALWSLMFLEQLTDLGLGNGLINAVATARGQHKEHKVPLLAAYSLRMLTRLALALVLVVVTLHMLVDARWVLTFIKPEDQQARLALLAVSLAIIVGAPVSVVEKVEAGYLEFSCIWATQILASLTTLSLLGAAYWSHSSPGLLTIALIFVGPSLLMKCLNWKVYFGMLRPDARPHYSSAGASEIRPELESLRATSWRFFALQLVYLGGFSFDYLIVGNFAGGESVGLYSCCGTYCGAGGVIASYLYQPLWAAYSEAFAAQDYAWCRRILRRSLLAVFVVTLLGCMAMHMLEPLLLKRFAPGLAIGGGILLASYLSTILETSRQSLNMFLNGTGRLEFQLRIHIFFLLLATPIKIWVLMRYGLEAFVWTKNVLLFSVLVIPAALVALHSLRHMKQGASDAGLS